MKYMIWCFERGMWWKPNSSGYTSNVFHAGKYTLGQAHSICVLANKVKTEEVMIPEFLDDILGENF